MHIQSQTYCFNPKKSQKIHIQYGRHGYRNDYILLPVFNVDTLTVSCWTHYTWSTRQHTKQIRFKIHDHLPIKQDWIFWPLLIIISPFDILQHINVEINHCVTISHLDIMADFLHGSLDFCFVSISLGTKWKSWILSRYCARLLSMSISSANTSQSTANLSAICKLQARWLRYNFVQKSLHHEK